ncbi:MAG: hypothetical protein DRP65_02010 [Planctomycetota bacterium]|nr:MAG: hypothetical protein DRP65_02010 [Planctomycetota bacterium]
MKQCHTIATEILLFFTITNLCYGQKITLSDTEINTKLMELKPLPKVHYYWPQSSDLDDRKLYELARITHSLCLSGDWDKQQKVERCVYTCARINKTNPQIKASLGVNFTPWHIKFDKKLPPTDRGPTYNAEIKHFEERARLIKKWVAESNKKYGSNVKISAVIFSSERFVKKKEDSKQWNDAIASNYNWFTRKAKSVFPDARMEWYAKGIVASASSEGWSRRPWHVEGEELERLSVELYAVPEPERTREGYRRTCQLADELGYTEVTPWVALAAGWRRHKDKFQAWSSDWDYDIIYSWMIGRELNIKWFGDRPKRFAPYNRAQVVVFYPRPFDKRAPHWAKHFIAYVRGATGIKELDDLGFEE